MSLRLSKTQTDLYAAGELEFEIWEIPSSEKHEMFLFTINPGSDRKDWNPLDNHLVLLRVDRTTDDYTMNTYEFTNVKLSYTPDSDKRALLYRVLDPAQDRVANIAVVNCSPQDIFNIAVKYHDTPYRGTELELVFKEAVSQYGSGSTDDLLPNLKARLEIYANDHPGHYAVSPVPIFVKPRPE